MTDPNKSIFEEETTVVRFEKQTAEYPVLEDFEIELEEDWND